MKVGDYVRTKNGDIFKYIKTDEDGKLRRTLSSDNENITTGFELSDVIKSSPNIKDLIEKGDYVNGYYVEEIEDNVIYNNYNCCNAPYIKIEAKDIKSIVTHEQFERMQYKVGE